ncbi:tyrosine-protein phosphatase non-receptor type 22 isoform X1 [Clarias gariepinus]|uniref:tyrosine-protein phosphatase non-receptor type 22 isoform X1 n=1 Tax=Clarias gariepinus TaxID=13013 RepID=UPI00234C513F|nr:tyrosine-protein phosphatase non-receptor type 22 isoform X1 [Clarias gariepinus]
MELQAQLLRRLLAQFASKEATSTCEDSVYAVEFLKLKRQSTKYRTDKTYSTKAAEKQENVKKNRYKDIVPFDHSRVKLSLNTSKNDTDYINANFIRGVWGPTEYIATQGPLPNTVLDFLRMIWEYNVHVIVMACREFEMGRKKCERYWPESMVEAFVCEPFTICCESEENKGDYLIRTLKITFHNSSRTLKQLHYMNWPDHGVPDSIPPILEMLQDMRVFQEQDDLPICIHCSAGCGRTGALCVIDYTWNLLKKQMIPDYFSIYDLVQEMRTQRPSIVQTKEQYELVYRAIKFLFEKHLQIMESNTKYNEVLAAPPLIPVDSNSEDSEFSESEEEPESVEGNKLYPFYDPRYSEKEVNTDFSNHFAPSAASQLLLPSHSRPPSPPGIKRTPAVILNDMKCWAMSKISPRATATSSQLQNTGLGHPKSQIQEPLPLQPTDLGYQNSQIHKPPPPQTTITGYQMSQTHELLSQHPADLGYQKSQILIPPPLQTTVTGYQMSQTHELLPQHPADLGYQMFQTLEPPSPQPTDLGNDRKSQIVRPPPLLPTDFGSRKSQILGPPPNPPTDLGNRKSQLLGPPPPPPTDLGNRKSQILGPPPLLPTDLGNRKSQILGPPPPPPTDLGNRRSQILGPPPPPPTNLGNQKHQILKPPRPQKTDLGYQNAQTPEPFPVQESNLGYQKSQILEPPFLHTQILEPSPVQQTNTVQLKSPIPKPPRSQKADLGCHKPQIPESATTNQNQETDIWKSNNPFSPTPVPETSPHQTHTTETNNNGALLQTPSICLTVEDPYFGPESPLSTRSPECKEALPILTANSCFPEPTLAIKTQSTELLMQDKIKETSPVSDEDSPPPLPERTPESFMLADEGSPQILTPTLLTCTNDSSLLTDTNMADMGDVEGNGDVDTGNTGNTENTGMDHSLTLVIPPDNSSSGENPPSPAPPLPERTPESYEMANDEDLLQNAVQEKPQETVLRVGKSSEWSGNSNLDTPDFMRSWSRSKSLKARLSLNVPTSSWNIQSFSPIPMPLQEPQKSLTPPLPERTLESFLMDASETPALLTPPLPTRTLESFIIETEEELSDSAPCQSEPVEQRDRLGVSSEWAGNSQPRTFLDVMTRSRSVKVKSSKQEGLSVAPQPDPNSGATAEPELPRAEDQTSMDSRRPAMLQPEKTALPKKSRTKSLKLWKGKPKTKEAPAPGSAPQNHGATSGFIFSKKFSIFNFGTRFGKPKGPRNQPETWV